MKALLLASVSPGLRQELMGEFRGSRAHNIEWLGRLYRRNVGIAVPGAITQHLSRVASWSTDLRYATGAVNQKEAREFFESVDAIAAWIDGRL
ncbi:MAG: hypothetical protein HY289_05720 [Planctomycetes bacterium]|nr:hypothetical protein [Planctomycetota bacterium]